MMEETTQPIVSMLALSNPLSLLIVQGMLFVLLCMEQHL